MNSGIESLVERLSFALFNFMRQANIRCTFARDSVNAKTFIFEVKDLTDDGTSFGMNFKVDTDLSADIEDSPEGIEKFCYATTLKIQTLMTEEKLGRLLQHVNKSQIYLPNLK